MALPRIALLGLVIVLLALVGCEKKQSSTRDSGGASRKVVGKAGARFPEPTPNMELPIGTPNPPFEGEIPKGALKVNRTGTYGGTIVYAEQGEVDTFNPIEPKGATSQEMRRILFSSLVLYANAAWEFRPGLAESWKVSDDHLTWTFRLREGLRFNNGRPLTVEDVEFTFNVFFDERFKTSVQDGFRDSQGRLPTVEIVDAQNIRLRTQEVSSQFLTHVSNVTIIPKYLWADAAREGVILQKMANDADPAMIVGSGPYRLKSYTVAEKIEFERNPHYWKVDARGQRLPYIDRLVVALVQNANLKWQKFAAGEHDFIFDIPNDHFLEAQKLERNKPDEYRLARLGLHVNTYWMCWNLHPGSDGESGEPFVDPEKSYWFNNHEFRVAMNHAIDREGLVRSAMKDRGQAIWSSFTKGNKLWHHAGVKKYPYDPDRANEILDSLGWKRDPDTNMRKDDRGNFIEFSMNTNSDNNMREQIGVLIKGYFAEVGVTVNFRTVTFNSLVEKLQDSHKWDVIILGWGSGVPPDPSNGKNIVKSSGRLHAWYPQQTTPATPWEAEVDELMGKMDTELEHAVRKGYNDRIQELIAENCPIFYLVSPNAYAMHKKSVGNTWPSVLRPSLHWNLDTLYIDEAHQR